MIKNPWPVYIVGFFVVMIGTVFLYFSGVLLAIVSILQNYTFVAEFTAGLMYASFFTTPTAILFITILSQTKEPLQIAIVAGLGTATVDLIIFKFFRYLFFGSYSPLATNHHFEKLVKRLRKKLWFRLSSPIIGGLIVASPLPDELGLAILGLSKISSWVVFLITFIFNAAGIFIVASLAKSLL